MVLAGQSDLGSGQLRDVRGWQVRKTLCLGHGKRRRGLEQQKARAVLGQEDRPQQSNRDVLQGQIAARGAGARSHVLDVVISEVRRRQLDQEPAEAAWGRGQHSHRLGRPKTV